MNTNKIFTASTKFNIVIINSSVKPHKIYVI